MSSDAPHPPWPTRTQDPTLPANGMNRSNLERLIRSPDGWRLRPRFHLLRRVLARVIFR